MKRTSIAVAALLLLCSVLAPQARAEGAQAFARVVAEESPLRAGPGMAHREIYLAHRGEIFPLESREGAGFWLRVSLPDGRTGFILGDTVQPVAAEQGDDRYQRPGFFAPPPLAHSRAGFAILGGVFDRSGYLELKPAFVLAPTVAFEPYVGMALTSSGNRLLYGAGATVHLAPDWPVEPYVDAGVGGLSSFPSADQLALKKETVWAARAGGGLLLALRLRILIRAEAHHVVLFTEDSYRNAVQVAGGLGVYF